VMGPTSSRLCFGALLVVLLVACTYAGKPGPVFLFSIDGMRTDYLQQARALGLPTLTRLIEGGTLASASQTVWPAVTFPSHTSMVTGVNPAKHGIWNNNVFGPLDANRNNHYFYQDITAKTIFDAAQELGLTAMGIDWPVTVGAPLDPLFPGNDDDPSTLDEAKWLWNTIKGPIKKVLPNPQALFGLLLDPQRAAIAMEFLDYKTPDLFAFHFNDLDGAEHAHGYMINEAIKTLKMIDSLLGQMLAKLDRMGLLANGTVIIASDHGFLNTTGTEISPGALLNALGVIGPGPSGYPPWQAWPDCSSGVCPIFIHPNASASVRDTVDQAVKILLSEPAYGIIKAYSAAEVAALGCWPGAHVMLQLDTKYQFGGFHDTTGDVIQCCGSRGQHGYASTLPEMHASFLINGPRIKANNKIGMIHIIDIAPTIAHIMGLNLPNVDGRVLTQVFRS